MVQSGRPGITRTEMQGGCRDPFRNNITKIKTFIEASMFIFLQYCEISRVSHLCNEAVSDSYVINYNFLYYPFSIEIDATSFLSKEMLYNCTYTDSH